MIPPLVGMDELRLAGVWAWLECELLTRCTTSPLETSTRAVPA
jgi:hypothetical protein